MAQSSSTSAPPPPGAALSPASRILILGSGVFGLSTALWLARSGFCDVTVLDMQDTAAKGYDPRAGVDSASADLNKILRFSYGSELAYQRLAVQAAALWDQWNADLAATPDAELPPVLRGGGNPAERKRLWWNAGRLRTSVTAGRLSEYELQTLASMEKDGLGEMQFRTDDEAGA